MSFLNDETLAHLVRIADQPDLSGTPYRLEREIGRGGMGAVFMAIDTRLNRRVAIKVITAGDREARIIASLEHPGIVPVHDLGLLPDGRAYYVMKYVEGLRLDEFLARQPSLRERLDVFRKLCDAVAFAHSLGVAHRDIKPQNAMVGAFGEVVLLDWGIAGDTAADPAEDVAALGRMLEYLLGGHSSKPLLAVASKAAARQYGDVAGVLADMARFLDGEAVTAYRESAWEWMARFAGRNKTLLLLVATYAAVKLILFFWPHG